MMGGTTSELFGNTIITGTGTEEYPSRFQSQFLAENTGDSAGVGTVEEYSDTNKIRNVKTSQEMIKSQLARA
jgi:hypothetical protein